MTGLALITFGSKRAWHILLFAFVAIGGGVIMSLPSFINATDSEGLLGWLAIVVVGIVLAATARAAVNMHKRSRTT